MESGSHQCDEGKMRLIVAGLIGGLLGVFLYDVAGPRVAVIVIFILHFIDNA